MCSWPDRAQSLVTLFDDVLQLPEHGDLCVLQVQLLSGGVGDARPVGGLRLVRLYTGAKFVFKTVYVYE